MFSELASVPDSFVLSVIKSSCFISYKPELLELLSLKVKRGESLK